MCLFNQGFGDMIDCIKSSVIDILEGIREVFALRSHDKTQLSRIRTQVNHG